MAQYKYKTHYWPGGQVAQYGCGRTVACGRIVPYGCATSTWHGVTCHGCLRTIRWHMPRPARHPRLAGEGASEA